MAKNKSIKRNNKKTQRRTKSRNKRIRKTKGGCGCANTLYKGGNINPPSFQTLPLRSYYELNNYNNDPASSDAVINSRNLANAQSGGRRTRKYRGTKKMRGGDLLLGNSSINNALTSFGTTTGAYTGSNIFSGVAGVNSSIIDQPAFQTYSNLSPPLA